MSMPITTRRVRTKNRLLAASRSRHRTLLVEKIKSKRLPLPSRVGASESPINQAKAILSHFCETGSINSEAGVQLLTRVYALERLPAGCPEYAALCSELAESVEALLTPKRLGRQ